MKEKNLHTLIDRYEQNYYMVNNREHNEKFKWAAVQCFRREWFLERDEEIPFSRLFDLATKKSHLLINNRVISPTSGIVKMAEKRPEQVEDLFRKLLFAHWNSVEELQDHMDLFLEKIEGIRQELFPRFYRYKQDRHAASCYLSFFDPEHHYIYRYSEAQDFARYIGFGKTLGAGSDFSLANYYEMAELVVQALKSHGTLLEKYEMLMKDEPDYYYDPSLHLMAFDLMYCCRSYNLYQGLRHSGKPEPLQAYTQKELREYEDALRQAELRELEQKICDLDVQIAEYREMSLLGVEVSQPDYGNGVVVEQQDEAITVQFDQEQVRYVINRKYPFRPHFEDEDEIVEIYTQLADLKKKRESLEREKRNM